MVAGDDLSQILHMIFTDGCEEGVGPEAQVQSAAVRSVDVGSAELVGVYAERAAASCWDLLGVIALTRLKCIFVESHRVLRRKCEAQVARGGDGVAAGEVVVGVDGEVAVDEEAIAAREARHGRKA